MKNNNILLVKFVYLTIIPQACIGYEMIDR